MAVTKTIRNGYQVRASALTGLRSGYRIATSGDLGLARFVEGEDPWADGMNRNLDRIDTVLATNAAAASSSYDRSTALASVVGGAGTNLLVNPDFSIWQRGTAFSGSSGFYTADQWKAEGTGAASIARGVGLNGALYSHRTYYTSGAGSVSRYIRQRIERPKSYRGLPLTLSADGSVIAGSGGSFRIAITDDAGTTTSGSATSSSRLLVSKTIDAAATFVEVRLYFESTTLGSSVYFEGAFGNVVLAVGSQSSLVFLPRHPSDEMVLCQRYFQVYSRSTGTFFAHPLPGLTNVLVSFPITFPPMYAAPTATLTSSDYSPAGTVFWSCQDLTRSSLRFLASTSTFDDLRIGSVVFTLEAALF